MKVGCVIPAAGWGSVCPIRSTPKVLAEIDGQAMLGHVVDIVGQAGISGTTVVVVGNNHYGSQVETALKARTELCFAVQPARLGAADAVARALPLLSAEENDVLVTLGDMPLWRPDTIRRLVSAHLSEPGATISMVTMRLRPGHRTERYGRIVRGEHGEILAAFEPWELNGHELPGAKFVNPSLYVFKRQWLTDNVPRIPPTDKGDGFPPELYLPKLLPLAHDQGVKILEIVLDDPSEALGVNTAEEYDEVCTIFSSRK